MQAVPNLLLGGPLRDKILEELKEKIARFSEKPKLRVFLVGDDPASQVYVANKEKAALQIGIDAKTIHLPSTIAQDELIKMIKREAEEAHAILVQLPLPPHLSEEAVVEAIPPEKDVDGFHPVNLGKLVRGEEGIVPCTPKGIIRLLDEHNIDIKGKRALVIGRSIIVGKPMALLLLSRHATVTIAHSRTENLSTLIKEHDIVVSAVGKPGLVQDVKEGAIVIDVGITRTPEGLRGDVAFESVQKRASSITPVPGGVGPMTIAMLMENTVICYELQSRT